MRGKAFRSRDSDEEDDSDQENTENGTGGEGPDGGKKPKKPRFAPACMVSLELSRRDRQADMMHKWELKEKERTQEHGYWHCTIPYYDLNCKCKQTSKLTNPRALDRVWKRVPITPTDRSTGHLRIELNSLHDLELIVE